MSNLRINMFRIFVFSLSASALFAKQAIAEPTHRSLTIDKPPLSKTLPQTINLNTASAKELASAIKGIGRRRAQAIIDYREKHGGFKQLNELSQVKGISSSFVKKHYKDLSKILIVD